MGGSRVSRCPIAVGFRSSDAVILDARSVSAGFLGKDQCRAPCHHARLWLLIGERAIWHTLCNADTSVVPGPLLDPLKRLFVQCAQVLDPPSKEHRIVATRECCIGDWYSVGCEDAGWFVGRLAPVTPKQEFRRR